MREADVGEFYLDAKHYVWQLVTYTDRPTAMLRRVDDESIVRHGVVGSPLLSEFVRLVPETSKSAGREP